jgi:hypothetical protein
MTKPDIHEIIDKRIAELPPVVQRAIEDASVEKKLRTLAQKHKLHLDQWVLLENEIMLTLLGLAEPEEMAGNIAREVRIDKDVAEKIVADIATQVFQPIRAQLRGEMSEEESERRPLQGASKTEPLASAKDTLKSSIPPGEPQIAPKPEGKKAPTDSTTYAPGKTSMERRDVNEDPYRESTD